MQRWTDHGFRFRVAAFLTLALTGAAVLPAQAKTAKAGAESAATTTRRPQPSKPARAALRAVQDVRKTATGKKGEARNAILRQAAQGYAKVITDFAAEPVVVAQASFAAAEIWRAQGELGRAKELYRQSLSLDADRFAERSQLQLAHLARREKAVDAAIAMYRKVAALEPKSGRAHQARLWIGRCQLQAGKADDAVQTFRAAIDQTPSPRQAIEACNRLANALVKLGRLDEAEQAVARARQASEQPAGGTGKSAASRQAGLAKAYAKMSARRALQRARDKKNKAHQDALELEKRR